jgi:lipopolysaccharide export system protein LptA
VFGASAVLLVTSMVMASAQLVNPNAGQPPALTPVPAVVQNQNQSPKTDSNKVTLEADTTRWYADDKVTATGNVKAVYQDYTITADSVDADLQTNVAVFKGNVKLITKQATINGGDLTLNLKTREWSLSEAQSEVSTAKIRGLVSQGAESGKGSPVFIQSAALHGSPKEIGLSTGSLTTCDQDHPHYFFSAKNLEIYPDNKIIARHVSMVGLDHRLISLGMLVVPIRGLKQGMIPQIGSSAEEGSFLKAAYPYMATEHSQGFLKLDLMQKRGVGIGLDHTLSTKLATSQASLYFLADRQVGGNNVTAYLRHQQKLGAFDLNLTGNYRTNNYLNYPQSTSQDWQAALSHLTSRSNTALTFRTSTSNGYGISKIGRAHV